MSAARVQLYRIWHLQLPTYIFGLIYQAFIVPLFDYCDVVWIPCLDKQFKAKEHICSARLDNLAGCVTGCVTGYPVTQSAVRMEYLNLHLSGCLTG